MNEKIINLDKLSRYDNLLKQYITNNYLPLAAGEYYPLTGKLFAKKGLDVSGSNFTVTNAITGHNVFRVDKTNGATKIYKADGTLNYELDSEGILKLLGANRGIEIGSYDFRFNNDVGLDIFVSGFRYTPLRYLKIEGYDSTLLDNVKYIPRPVTKYSYNTDSNGNIIGGGSIGNGSASEQEYLTVGTGLAVRGGDIRLYNGESSDSLGYFNPTLTIDNNDGSIEAGGYIFSHNDVLCGNSITSPTHKLSKKLNVADAESLYLKKTENDTSAGIITAAGFSTNGTISINGDGILGLGTPSREFVEFDTDEQYDEFAANVYDGIYLATKKDETAGLHISGDGITLWAPPDNWALAFYNEDDGEITWQITGDSIAKGFSDPEDPQDLATKNYVDQVANRLVIVGT